jgi:glutathione S-transferase
MRRAVPSAEAGLAPRWPLPAATPEVHPAAVITLHTMPGTDTIESMSPFCMKVEVYLKLQKIPYKVHLGDPRKAPKRKLPVIEVDGRKIADSSAIFDYLEGKADHPLDRGLDAAGRARAHVLKRLFEQSLYFVLVWSRWADDPGWEEMRGHVEKLVPAPLRWLVPGIIRKKVIASTVAEGIGRHSRDEIYAFGKADLTAIAELLGEGPYLLGTEPRTIDVIGYAFLANILRWPKPCPLTDDARALPALEAYVNRIDALLAAAKSAAETTTNAAS